MEGNQMKMREALVLCSRIIGANGIRGNVFLSDIQEAHEAITAALSAPPRQCDVGTPEEKYRRWVHFCEQRLHSCHNCECNSPVGCTFKFGDMPYIKEGGEA